jgi:peptide/nickel transport system substrate-binding protein
VFNTRLGAPVLCLVMLVACSAPATPTAQVPREQFPKPTAEPATPAQRKTITIGVVVPFLAFSLADTQSGSGSGIQLQEMWLQGLVTSGVSSPAPEARIAAELPSLDQGSIRVEPDGRMTVTWRLRDDVKWADGTPLTAPDFAFGFQVQGDTRLSYARGNLARRVQSLTAPDDRTLVMVWSEPYYLANAIGTSPNALQPLPRHILQEAYERGPIETFENHPYWTTEFLHVGPYRPTRFDPQGDSVFEAVPHYFLGTPKVSTIVIKSFADPNATYAAILARAIDLSSGNALTPALGLELKERWDASGEGTVFIGPGVTQFVAPQFSPELQTEPAFFDPNVRRALFHALDRQAWSESVMGGRRIDNMATSLLPGNHHLSSYTRDSLAAFTYDPARATALLAQAGWNLGSDRLLTNTTDGRRFTTVVWSTQESEAVILADMWKQIGLDTSVYVVPRARQSDRQFWQSYPNVEVSSRGYGDDFLERFDCAYAPGAANSWAGDNRGHYCNRTAMEPLLAQYRRSLTLPEQGESIRRISELAAQELPVFQTYFMITRIAVARGTTAMQDFAGGMQGAGLYGSFYRNAHLWDRT